MPSQAWDGSWYCDACGMAGFRTLQDADHHQREDCQQPNRKRQRPGSPGHAGNAEPMSGGTGRSLPRRVLLLGAGERHTMELADAVACQNLELFEATGEYTEERAMVGSAAGVPGQVGIRCVHCVRTPLSAMGQRLVFPNSVFAVGSGVRAVAERHLILCPLVPQHDQETIERGIAGRRHGQVEDEEISRKALLDHCAMLCQEVGVVDRYPQDSGISYGEDDRPTPQRPAEHNSFDNPVSLPESTAGLDVSPIVETSFVDDMNYPRQSRRHRKHASTDRPRQDDHEGSFPKLEGALPGGPPLGYSGYPQFDGPPPFQMPMQPPQVGGYPYYQCPDGSWECRYCSMIHPQHRDHGSVWQRTDPPPGGFIDRHLGVCRFFNQSMQGSLHQPFPGTGFPGQQPMAQEYPYGDGPTGHQQHPYNAPLSPHQGPPPAGWGPPPGFPSPYRPPPPMPGPQVYMPAFQQGQDSSGMGYVSSRPDRPTRGMSAHAESSSVASSDQAKHHAIEYLSSATNPPRLDSHQGSADEEQLVLDEDRMLLTDYFYFIMKQLRVCRFTEADRKTRGGKRENIALGYGGLQCIHCANAPNARKFFWSNVDRLANSFAEIPGHILKCRRCPVPTKSALQELKKRHPDHMTRLPRGSQKVFFRRMWRRLHDNDPPQTPIKQVSNDDGGPRGDTIVQGSTRSPAKATSPLQVLSPSTSGEESAFLIERSTEEAARALAGSHSNKTTSPPSPSSRVRLAIPEDKEWLSDMDCFVRRNLEVFCASDEDVRVNREERKYPIEKGQVGVRCLHCAIASGREGLRGHVVSYPYSIGSIYESVREFQRLHLEACDNLPPEQKSKMATLKGTSSLTSVLRKYYVLAAKALGLYDTPDGIRSGAESVPLGSSAAFAFSPESESHASVEMNKGDAPPTPPADKNKHAPVTSEDVATPSDRAALAESSAASLEI